MKNRSLAWKKRKAPNRSHGFAGRRADLSFGLVFAPCRRVGSAVKGRQRNGTDLLRRRLPVAERASPLTALQAAGTRARRAANTSLLSETNTSLGSFANVIRVRFECMDSGQRERSCSDVLQLLLRLVDERSSCELDTGAFGARTSMLSGQRSTRRMTGISDFIAPVGQTSTHLRQVAQKVAALSAGTIGLTMVLNPRLYRPMNVWPTTWSQVR